MRRLRWTGFALAVFAYALSYFHRMAPATIATDLQSTFNTTGAVLGGISATYFYVYTVMQLPAGVLVDTLGPRRLLGLGGLVAGIGSLMFGLAESVSVLSTGRLLVGLGVSVTFLAMLKLHAAWMHDRHFGQFTGLSILLGNLGAVLAAAPLAWVLGFVSWRTVFEVVGLLSLALGLLSFALVRNNPGDAGLPSMRELEGHAAHPPHHGHWFEGLLHVLRNRDSWPAFWVNIGLCGSFFAFAGLWAVPQLMAIYGLTRAEASQYSTLLLIGFALGALTIGWLSDRLGRRKPVMLTFAALHLLCWLPLLASAKLPHVPMLALFFLMGLGAASFTLSWACAKEVNPHALSGMAMSIANTGSFLGAGILQPLVGWSVDRTGGHSAGLWILFGFAAIGLVAALKVRETYCRYAHEGH
jgi:sugar phosphate permease